MRIRNHPPCRVSGADARGPQVFARSWGTWLSPIEKGGTGAGFEKRADTSPTRTLARTEDWKLRTFGHRVAVSTTRPTVARLASRLKPASRAPAGDKCAPSM
jgi:hypothetical protein